METKRNVLEELTGRKHKLREALKAIEKLFTPEEYKRFQEYKKRRVEITASFQETA